MRPALVAVLFVLACTACRREEPRHCSLVDLSWCNQANLRFQIGHELVRPSCPLCETSGVEVLQQHCRRSAP